MSKNIFEENKRINFFDSLNFNSRGNIENANSSTKNSKRSNNSSFKDNGNKPNEQVIKEVHETQNKPNKSKLADSTCPTATTSTTTPAMYKIAMRIKRLTENKMKKTQSDSATLSNKSFKDESIKIKSIIKDLNSPLNEENMANKDETVDFELELDSSKTSG